MTVLTASNAVLCADILDVLEAESPVPVHTMYIADRLGARGEYGTLLRMLNRLARRGDVEKWAASGDKRCCYWRKLTPCS